MLASAGQPTDRRASLVRVLRGDGSTAGAGFVVNEDGLLATCAHVLRAADPDAAAQPPSHVLVEYLAGYRKAQVAVEPTWWRADTAEDVAFLRGEPGAAPPVALSVLADPVGRPFETFGFPTSMGRSGLWGYGRFGGLLDDRDKRIRLLQLREANAVTRGFSGSPVFDGVSGTVVGMVTEILAPDSFGRLADTGFATPVDVLQQICPALRPQVQDIAAAGRLSLDDLTDEECRLLARSVEAGAHDMIARIQPASLRSVFGRSRELYLRLKENAVQDDAGLETLRFRLQMIQVSNQELQFLQLQKSNPKNALQNLDPLIAAQEAELRKWSAALREQLHYFALELWTAQGAH
jgi:S1-C subfamily serine protease